MVRITTTHKLTGHKESLLESNHTKAEAMVNMIRTFGNIESVEMEPVEEDLRTADRTCHNIRAPL